MIIPANEETRPRRRWACAEIALIFLVFFVLAGTPPPDVNEAHYLAKAKHYWNPDWCQRDFFLNSADAHAVFYWSFGWLTLLFPLPVVAWIGRVVTWGLLAWAWRRLCLSMVSGKLYPVLGAALFATLVQWGHMSGEWVVGGVEAKGFAFVLVLLGLEALLRGRWQRALILCGVATSFHVLVGGWTLIALAGVWITLRSEERPALQSLWPALLLAAAASLPGLLPALKLTWSADPQIVREANRIYVYERLPHHLVFHTLPHAYIARHVALLVAWFVITRWLLRQVPDKAASMRRLNRVVVVAFSITVLGALIDQSLLSAPHIAAPLLRYYWFRLSDVMVPLGVSVALVVGLDQLSTSHPQRFARMLAAMLLLVIASIGHEMYQHFVDPRPGGTIQASPGTEWSRDEKLRRFHEWTLACEWIRNNTRPDDLFLTPRQQQSFKWYAERSEVVCAKDIPQDATGILEWRRRMDEVFPPSARRMDLTAGGEHRLAELAEEYRFAFVVVDRAVDLRPLSLPRVYPERSGQPPTYEVYRVPPPAKP